MTNRPSNGGNKPQSDLLNKNFNKYGFAFPNNYSIMGEKGDVHTFFLVLNDCIESGILENSFSTITHDLYKTLVNKRNIVDYQEQLPGFFKALSEIPSKKVEWDKYPSRDTLSASGLSNLSLKEVFQKYEKPLERAPFWINRYLDRGMEDFPRLYVSPIALSRARTFRKYKDIVFLESEDDPLWLRDNS